MDHTLIPTIPLFAGVKGRRRQELAALADEITVPAGTTLTREGAHADEFFVIVDGEADVVARRLSPLERSDAPTRLGTLGPGDFFGEIGLLDGPKRSATVVSTTPMRLLVAHSRDFRTLMHSFPDIAKPVRAAFATRTGGHREHKGTDSPARPPADLEPIRSTGVRRWFGLALLCAAFFMVILDVAIVNVALPSIQADLEFSQHNLQWVVSAYALTFGCLLLLGGRAADLLGRRRVFVAGVAVFALASLLGGLAPSGALLIAARALQGIGAAAMTPAALSILMSTFREGAERNKALGVWGAVGASGGTIGLLVGGVLTETVGWEWIFLLNVPVGAVVIALSPLLLDETRALDVVRRFDLAGAATVTMALSLLVYDLVDAGAAGWTSVQTVGLAAASAFLLAAFAVIERRSSAPLLPFRIFRLPALLGSNVAGVLFGASVYGMFFIITLYLQEVRGYSPLEAGLAWLALSLTALVTAVGGAQLVTRTGPRRPLVAGLAVVAAGTWLLARVPADASYVRSLLPALVVSGIGIGLAFVTLSIGALEGVEERDSGLASGLVNTAQQIGGALGVAVLSTIAVSRSQEVLAAHPKLPPTTALTEGFGDALLAGAAFAAAGALLAAVLIRRPVSPAAATVDPKAATVLERAA